MIKVALRILFTTSGWKPVIVVTADHETGGFVLGKGPYELNLVGYQEPEGQWKRDSTKVIKPNFASKNE